MTQSMEDRIDELEAQLVVTARDLATAQQEDLEMVRDRDDALMALGNAALKIERMELSLETLGQHYEELCDEQRPTVCTPAERALIETAITWSRGGNDPKTGDYPELVKASLRVRAERKAAERAGGKA